MSIKTLVSRIHDNIEILPEDLFSIKSLYLSNISELAGRDIDSAIVKLGKAGERLAKGFLDFYKVTYYDNDSFDYMLKALSSVSPSPTLIIELRSVLKYRNLAAHDAEGTLTVYDLDAAAASFCAAYQTAYNIIHNRKPASDIINTDAGAPASGSAAVGPVSWIHSGVLLKYTRVLCFITAALLLWAADRGGSYNFFLLLRITVTAVSICAAYLYFAEKNAVWIVFTGLAVLFNPLFAVPLSRAAWKVIDVAAAVVFIAAGIVFARKKY